MSMEQETVIVEFVEENDKNQFIGTFEKLLEKPKEN